MRIYVYVDGFNLYYRALKDTPHKWINLKLVAQRLLDPADTVTLIRYFTARVSSRAGDPEAPRRQQIFFNALSTIPELQFHFGKFLAKTKRRPLVADPKRFVEIHDTEEKGSDVNLAVHLLNDGWHRRYDVALILSQDTDLIEAIRIVKQELCLTVGLVCLDQGSPNRFMKEAASFVRHLRPADLAASQFPNPITDAQGRRIYKPETW